MSNNRNTDLKKNNDIVVIRCSRGVGTRGTRDAATSTLFEDHTIKAA